MVHVRGAEPSDVAAIAAVHAASVRGLAAAHYDDDQIASWSDSSADDFSLPEAGGRVVVAETDDSGGSGAGEEIAGFGAIDLQSGEVRAVYVHPDNAGTGVGSAILEALEATASDEGLADLHLTASLNAVPFYERHGWASTGPAAYELGDGVELEAVEMEKSL